MKISQIRALQRVIRIDFFFEKIQILAAAITNLKFLNLFSNSKFHATLYLHACLTSSHMKAIDIVQPLINFLVVGSL